MQQADVGPVSVATEPEAAAVHYASTTRVAPGEVVAVYDLGGAPSTPPCSATPATAPSCWATPGLTDRDGPADIYVLDLATGELTKLTNSPEDEGDPAWSPDGASIAYWSRFGGNQDIYVIPADGAGTARRLTEDPGDDGDPAWNPRTGTLVFSRLTGGDWEIFTIDADGVNEVQVTDADKDDQDPSWSSDGARIAFETKRDTPEVDDQAEVYVMNADGSDQRNVTNRPGLDVHPAWGTPPA